VLAVLDHRQFGRAFVLSIGEAGHEATTAPVSSGAGWRSPASGARSKARQRTGCRSVVPWPVLAALDHRRFGRAFVLSIGEAGHEATTAPVSSGAGWRSPASGARSNAGQRNGCRSVVPWPGQALGVRAIRGCRWRGPCWKRSTIGSSVGPSFSRSVKPATKRRRRQCRAVPGGDRRQAVPGRRRDSIPAADRSCRGLVRISGCLQASVADVRQGCRRRGSCWQCSITGSSVGLSSSRSVKPATKRRRRQCRAVPGGDRRQVVPGRRRDSIPAADRGCRGVGRISGCWQCSIAGSSVGPSSSRLVKPATKRRRRLVAIAGKWARARRDSVPAADRGCRGVGRLSGCRQSAVAAGVARAGSARLSAVRSGLRSLDR
jgi:hypothetical protein